MLEAAVKYPSKCPSCDFNLDGGDIYESMLSHYKGDEAKALESAGLYGWSKDNPERFTNILSVYDTDTYVDCVVREECPECHHIFWKLGDGKTCKERGYEPEGDEVC